MDTGRCHSFHGLYPSQGKEHFVSGAFRKLLGDLGQARASAWVYCAAQKLCRENPEVVQDTSADI